jgi:glutamate--cysteine ligase
MTSKDSYISPLIMENKITRKNSYGSMGFGIPIGAEFNDIEKKLYVPMIYFQGLKYF